MASQSMRVGAASTVDRGRMQPPHSLLHPKPPPPLQKIHTVYTTKPPIMDSVQTHEYTLAKMMYAQPVCKNDLVVLRALSQKYPPGAEIASRDMLQLSGQALNAMPVYCCMLWMIRHNQYLGVFSWLLANRDTIDARYAGDALILEAARSGRWHFMTAIVSCMATCTADARQPGKNQRLYYTACQHNMFSLVDMLLQNRVALRIDVTKDKGLGIRTACGACSFSVLSVHMEYASAAPSVAEVFHSLPTNLVLTTLYQAMDRIYGIVQYQFCIRLVNMTRLDCGVQDDVLLKTCVRRGLAMLVQFLLCRPEVSASSISAQTKWGLRCWKKKQPWRSTMDEHAAACILSMLQRHNSVVAYPPCTVAFSVVQSIDLPAASGTRWVGA